MNKTTLVTVLTLIALAAETGVHVIHGDPVDWATVTTTVIAGVSAIVATLSGHAAGTAAANAPAAPTTQLVQK